MNPLSFTLGVLTYRVLGTVPSLIAIILIVNNETINYDHILEYGTSLAYNITKRF